MFFLFSSRKPCVFCCPKFPCLTGGFPGTNNQNWREALWRTVSVTSWCKGQFQKHPQKVRPRPVPRVNLVVWEVYGKMWFAQSDRSETRRNSMESKSGSIQPRFPMKKDMIATKPFRHITTNIYDWHISHFLFHLRKTNMECKKHNSYVLLKLQLLATLTLASFFMGPLLRSRFPATHVGCQETGNKWSRPLPFGSIAKVWPKPKTEAIWGDIFHDPTNLRPKNHVLLVGFWLHFIGVGVIQLSPMTSVITSRGPLCRII